MKYILFLSSIFIFSLTGNSQHNCSHKNHKLSFEKSSSIDNLRSDTIDILNYTVNLDITDYANQTIKGSCKIDFVSLKNNVSNLNLDLLRLTVDSIVDENQNLLTSTYNDTLLAIQLPSVLNSQDTTSITVYYNGAPQGDPSGWGGWYFQGNYAYNLGVGFQDNPHNYGRIWHPCFDNFVERATYDFNITTATTKSAYCNGLPTGEVINGSVKTTSWRMNQKIPTYLACIAVGNYTHVEQSYNSSITNTSTPIYLTAEASDTTNFKNSFVNLTGALTAFENGYGAYEWDKIGYSLVPFNSGAMEHATNIAYPKSSVNGTLTYETLMAHELSHHWWGNLVTCRTEGDMWINEGMASYSERLFLEHIYGYASYLDDIRKNHKDVLHHAHITDNGFRALHGIPHEYTYGAHSYNKGADVAHTLRSYLGDVQFFSVLTAFLQANKYKDVDAYDFRDFINANTNVNITPFFDNWIFNPGFPHFSIDSMKTVSNGSSYTNTIYVRQKLRAAPNFFVNVPLDITFRGLTWQEDTHNFIMGSEYASFEFTTAFPPVLAYLNDGDKISQAVTAESKVLNSTGTKNFSYAFFQTTVNNISDSAFIKVEHNWVAPDVFKDNSKNFLYNLSTERYWTLTGILPITFDASMKLYYNGRNNAAGNLDTELTTTAGFNEDSLVLFYRRNAGDDWEAVTNCTFNSLGSKTDGYGRVDVSEMRLGQYTFGWKRGTVGIEELNVKYPNTKLNISPNLTNSNLTISLNNYNQKATIKIYDITGKLIYSAPIQQRLSLNVENWKSGNYFVSLLINDTVVGNERFVKK